MTREIRAHIWFKMIDKNGDRTESVLNAAKIHLYTQEAWWTVPEEIDEWTTPTSQSADLTPKAVGMPTTPQQFSDLTAIVLGPKDQTVADFIGNLRYRFKDYDKKEIVIKFLDAQNYIGYDLNELQFATLLDCFSSVTIDCGYHNVIFPETKEASLNRLSISNANIKFPAVEMFASNFSLENCSLEGIDDPVFVRITTEESCSISRTSFKNALYLQVQAKAESLPKWQNNTCKINQLTLNFSQEKERTKRNGYFAAYGFSTVEALSLYAVSAAKTTPFFEFIQCTDLSIIDVQTKSLSNRQSPDVTITSCNKSFIGRSKFITALTDASTSQPVMVSEGRQISFTMSNCISDGRGLLKIANLSATRIMIESCVTRNHAKPFFAMATSVDTFSFNKADIDNIDSLMAATIKGLNLKDTSLKGDTISLVGADSLRMNNSTLQLSGNLNIEVTDTTNVYIDGSAIVADSIILSRKGDPTASDNSAFKLDNLSKISGKKLSISGINKFSLMRSKLKLKSIDVKVAQLSESSFDIDAADIIEGVRFDSPIVRGFTIILTRASRSPSIKFSNMRNNGSVNIHLRDPNSDKVSRGDILVELENVRITGEISNEQIAQAAVCRLTSADSLGSSFFVKADEKSLGNINIIPQVGCKDFFAMKRNTPTEVKTSKYIYYGNANT